MPIPTIQETAGVIADPELRFTQQGKAVLSIRLAFNDSCLLYTSPSPRDRG